MRTKLKRKIRELMLSPEFVDELHALFRICLSKFAENDLFTMAMSGTLLGIVRRNDYILWDDDVDMAVNFSDYDRIMALNDQLKQVGVEIHNSELLPWRKGKTWRHLKFRPLNKLLPFVDLFPFVYDGTDYRMPPKGNIPASWYTRNVFKVHEIFPLQHRALRDLEVPCPHNPLGFIERSYGKEALQTCVITHQHDKSGSSRPLLNIERNLEKLTDMSIIGKKFPCALIEQNERRLEPEVHWVNWLVGSVIFVMLLFLLR